MTSENQRRAGWAGRAAMPGGTARRCLAATCVAAVGILAFGAPADNPPEPRVAMEVFNTVESWVRQAEIPDETEPTDPISAAFVVLRYQGRIVGRGSDTTGDGLTVVRAAERAWAEARWRLPVPADELAGDNLREAAAEITISLELAGRFIPTPARSVPDVVNHTKPGLDGVAVGIGDRIEAMFPGMMLATGTDPMAATRLLFTRVRTDLAADPDGGPTPDELLREEAATVYRFRTVHIAHPAPGRAPIFLRRGEREIGVWQLDTPALREFAGAMAAHLIRRRWAGEESYGMVGTLNPTIGASDPLFEGVPGRAAAALALRRFAQTRGVDPTVAAEAERFALHVLESLAEVEADEAQAWSDPGWAAACVAAVLEPPGVQSPRAERLLDRCGEVVRGSFSVEEGFAGDVAPGARGLVAWALVRLARHEGNDDGSLELAEAAVRAVYAEAGAERLVTHMPWIGFAELELAGDDAELPASIALREARALVWTHQFRADDADPEDGDLIGSIIFTASRNPMPSWHSARPVAWLAAMLGDPRLTDPSEVPGEVARVVLALRFLRQLAADDVAGHMYRYPDLAQGGIRSALWDQRMPAEATALSLLAVCEALKSLESLGGTTP